MTTLIAKRVAASIAALIVVLALAWIITGSPVVAVILTFAVLVASISGTCFLAASALGLTP